jgi:aryl-phospho-beta-D-glucosidase BglC (GH1 family)
MNISNRNRIARTLTVFSLIFVVVASFAVPQKAQASGVCSPATAISVPFAKDGTGDFCYVASDMCTYINSWGMTTLEINGTSYLNLYVLGSAIPPLNGVYTIHYVSTNPYSHFEIVAPCTGPTATYTPAGPTATFTRTNTPSGPTATPTKTATPTATPTKTATPVSGSGVVSTYGRLQISNTQLKASNGTAIQLAGMSSHGLTWFPLIDLNLNNTTNQNAFKQQITFNPAGGTPFPYTSSGITNLVNQWHIQVIRASMFPYDPWNGAEAKSYDNGTYPEWKYYNLNLVNTIVQSAINNNIYVIIDWHAGEGNDTDPTPYWTSGHVQEFFNYMVDKWGSYPNVIYETVNSPTYVSWNPTLKTYNQNVIDLIRARENSDGYANDNLIIAGTPTWSQDVDVATNDPLTGNMIAYNYMWYAGTHFSWVQSRGDTALANLNTKAPNQTLFMGEVGTSTSDGNGGVYYSNFNTLMEWAKTKKLSWLNWSIANKNESSAIFVPAIPSNMANNEIAWRGGDGGSIAQAMASTGQPMRMGPWNDADLSCSGKFIKGWMLNNTSQAVPSGC